jgi:hypothetical protein
MKCNAIKEPKHLGCYKEGGRALELQRPLFDVHGPPTSLASTVLKAPLALALGKRYPTVFLGHGSACLFHGDLGVNLGDGGWLTQASLPGEIRHLYNLPTLTELPFFISIASPPNPLRDQRRVGVWCLARQHSSPMGFLSVPLSRIQLDAAQHRHLS